MQNSPTPVGPGFEGRNIKIFKNLLQYHTGQMLGIWYVELPRGHLSSLFKR